MPVAEREGCGILARIIQASGGRQPTGLRDEAGGLTPTARSPAQQAQDLTDKRLRDLQDKLSSHGRFAATILNPETNCRT